MARRPGFIDRPSPSFGERRNGARPEIIVLHYTAMPSTEAALDRLCDPAVEVSSHFLISEQGVTFRLVPEEFRSWHAGAGAWGRVNDVNSHSIGIELSNTGAAPFPEPQMAALEGLLVDLMERHGIAPEKIIGHSDMAPERKSDPGRRFDWRRLARGGLSVWPAAGGAGSIGFLEAAQRFGYVPPDDCANAEGAILEAFRQRFRPFASGPLDETDIALMQDLARRFPVDVDAYDP